MSGLYRFIYCESVPIYPPEILLKNHTQTVSGFYLWNSPWSSHGVSQFGHLQRPCRNRQPVLDDPDFSSVSMEIGCWFMRP